MSWTDFYRRRDALDAVLLDAAANPAGPLAYDQDVFSSADEVLQALHHRWTRQLTGRLGVALEDEDDRVETVTRTWRAVAADQPVLRAVLDRHLPAGVLVEREQRMLALTAGLAELTEPTDEITRVGAAFTALIRGDRAARPARGLAKSA